jgi:hypothetical protein
MTTKTKRAAKLHTVADLAAALGADSPARINRAVYKSTDCGASLSLKPVGRAMLHNGDAKWVTLPGSLAVEYVTVQSIVEGIEETTEAVEVKFPATQATLWAAMGEVERQASDLWNETHGCEDCGEENDIGYRTINPKCKACGGSGTTF